ncbi:hypothetical protein CE195_03290 [Sodalis-like symbiont of Philaenus spumarius]|nr:hypothetical protein CE195_03290 [Sodalis-like symbiont of Philaenus spumarius]
MAFNGAGVCERAERFGVCQKAIWQTL